MTRMIKRGKCWATEITQLTSICLILSYWMYWNLYLRARWWSPTVLIILNLHYHSTWCKLDFVYLIHETLHHNCLTISSSSSVYRVTINYFHDHWIRASRTAIRHSNDLQKSHSANPGIVCHDENSCKHSWNACWYFLFFYREPSAIDKNKLNLYRVHPWITIELRNFYCLLSIRARLSGTSRC